MRLISLQLTKYGHFNNQSISFDARPNRINLLYAPNGAGKSILRHAFCDLLFGIAHPETPMAFRFGNANMRITAEAIGPDGERFGFGRKKGLKNTLLNGDGQPDETGQLARLLGPTDRTLLERLFALDTERLRSGGRQLLESGGQLSDALLAAGGLRGAKALRQSLETTAEALAPARRHPQRSFYRTLDALLDARKRAKAALLRPEDWARLEQQLAEAEAQQQQQNAAAAAAARRTAQLQRIRRVRLPMAERDAAAAWLADHQDAPDLPESLQTRLTETTANLAIETRQFEIETARRATLAAELDPIVLDQPVLDAAGEIERLGEQEGAVRKALTDIPQRAAEHATILARMAALLRRLGTSTPPERAIELIPTRAAESRARTLITRHGAIAAAVEQAPLALAAAIREAEETASELANLPAVAISDGLAALVAEIRAPGDPLARADEACRATEASRAALGAALALLPGGGSAADLPALPPESYERLATTQQTAASELGLHRERVAAAAEQRDRAISRLAAITAGGQVADESAIAAARRHRDRGWQLIYRLAFSADPPTAAEQSGFSGGQPLPLAYQEAVQAADQLADRRVLQADLVATAAAAQRAVADAQTLFQAAEAALLPALEAADQAASAWSAACAALPLGASPGIEEVRSFLRARDHVIEQRRLAQQNEQALARLTERHAQFAARLAALLDRPEAGLETLLAEAEQRLTADRRDQQRRAALQTTLRDRQHRQKLAQGALEEARRRHAAWAAEWETALTQLSRPAGEAPEVTVEILGLLTELHQDIQRAGELAGRLSDMRADNAAFSGIVDALLTRAAPDLAAAGATSPLERLDALRHLRERLREQRGRVTRRGELQKMLDQADRQIARLRQQLARRQADLASVLAAVGADTVEAAEQRLLASAGRRAQAAALAQAEARLREDGDGLTLVQLREELDTAPADEVAASLVETDAAMQAAQQAAQAAVARATQQRLQMERQTGDAAYEIAAAEQQEALAALGRVLEEAMLHRVAAGMLETAMATVEAQSGPQMLARISRYFQTLSCGAYERIVAEPGVDDLPVAVIPADEPDGRKRVAELSEGTRDQLFLAFRLAAIEEHVASAPALPFIGDDILQTADDDRATAALHALLALSRHVQVILLTHHPHIVQLAAALPDGALHICHLSGADLAVAAK